MSQPGLLPLANNGGSTDTVALQSGSPAIATGDVTTCQSAPVLDLDQRGTGRSSAGRGCDIGAYDTSGSGGVVHARYFVAPGGSDAVGCAGNTSASPFATIQRAVACSTSGDVISLAPSGSRPYPGIGSVSDNVTIQARSGAGARMVAIDADHAPLSVAPGAVVALSGVTLSCPTRCSGAPSVTNQGTLTLSRDSVTGNQSLDSAILNTTPANSSSSAALSVIDTTISGNIARLGGAIQSNPGTGATGPLTLTVANSTIAGNYAQTGGGGIAVLNSSPGSSASIVNTTITNNSAQQGVGGLYSSSGVSLDNTIIATNTVRVGSTSDCQGPTTAGTPTVADGPAGHNLIGNGTGCPTLQDGTNHDQVGTSTSPVNPLLAPLAYDGGMTETTPPLAGSPAIGAGDAASCEAVPVLDLDQRGVTRAAPSRSACDIGSADTGGVIAAQSAPAITSSAAADVTESSPGVVKVTAAGSPTSALSESGALPSGLSFTDNGNGTASLSGTPAAGSAGSYPITLTAANGVGPGASQSFTLTVAALSATGASPTTIAQGTNGLAVTIAGTGFEPGASLTASVPGITFSSVVVKSPTVISVKETADPGVPTGAYDVTVHEPGTSSTCSGCLHVLAQPTVTAISVPTLATGATGMPLTISGTDFWSPAKVSFTGPSQGVTGTVTFVGATSLSVKITVPATATPGAYSLKLANGDGGVATCTGCLTVVAGPQVSGISPTTVLPGRRACSR